MNDQDTLKAGVVGGVVGAKVSTTQPTTSVPLTRTFSELQEVDQVIGQLYAKDETLKQSKFGYAYDQFHKKNYAPILKDFQEAFNYIRIENALEDEKTKAVLTEEITPQNSRGFKYSKAGLKKCMEDELACIEKFNLLK